MLVHPATEFFCRRCGTNAGYDPETCWFCSGPLCNACWDTFGHCGHAQADAVNRAAAEVAQPPAADADHPKESTA